MAEHIRIPAVDGWFSMPSVEAVDRSALIGSRCVECKTYVFPPRTSGCPNPTCTADELIETPLSRRGTIWSYTENRYAPPPPYKAADPFEPYALAAVELEAEGLIVLGQVVEGVLAADLEIGMEMEIVLQTLFTEVDDNGDTVERVVYAWAPATTTERAHS